MASTKKSGTKAKASAKKRPAKKKKATAAAAPKRIAQEPMFEAQEATFEAEQAPASPPERDVAAIPSARVVGATLTTRAVRGVRDRDITAFLRQFIMLLDAGTPILKALTSLSTRGEHQGIRNMVMGIKEYVESGNTLWQAFARESKYFPSVFVNLVKAAEASGTLTTVLKRLVSYRERREMLRKRIMVALIYPTIITVLCFAVIVIIAKYLIPMFRDIFGSFENVELGAFTRGLMNTSEIIANWWWAAVLLVAALIALYKFWYVRDPLRRLTADRIKLRIPVMGSILRRSATVDFCRTLALMLRSGISMMATLDLVRNAVSNQAFVEAIQEMRDSVERGEGLEPPLRAAERSKVLDGVVADMLATGEESGTLDQIADQIADTYEEEVKLVVDSLGEIMLPIVIVFMGGIVTLVALAVYLPIIDMMSNI